MVLSRLTKITGPGVATDTNWVGNNADFTGITTTATSFNIGVTTIHSNLIEAHNIKSTGIITATGGSFSGNVTAVDGSFSGNVSIAGTLTYEDVTNIDSVGVITARDGISITSGNIVGNNSTNISGVSSVTATNYYGNGASLSGIEAAPTFQATASGSIANGKTIVLNSDATVSAAATTLTTQSIGSVVEISSPAGGTMMLSSVWVSDTKVVVAWALASGARYVYMAVGTVSGTSITYGTPVLVPGSVRGYTAGIIWDASVSAGAIFIGDSWNAEAKYYGFTVSGTTVSVRAVSSSGYVQDSGEKKCIRAASNGSGGFAIVYTASNGTLASKVGTINSSADLSIGNNSNTYGGQWTGQYQYGNSICDIAYAPDRSTATSSTYGVSTIDGTTGLRVMIISGATGTSHTLNTGSITQLVSIDNSMGASLTYNTEFNCFYMVYRVGSACYSRTWKVATNGTSVQDIASLYVSGGESGYGCDVEYNPTTKNAYIVLTRVGRLQGIEVEFASDSSITASSEYNITATGTESELFTMAANNTLGKVFAAASDTSSPKYGDTHIWQSEIITTNLTTSNFLGFSAAAYTNGQTVTIKTVGNVDANQTGLTPASKYYVTTGGNLSLTADDPSVYAGLSLNSTSIAVKFPV